MSIKSRKPAEIELMAAAGAVLARALRAAADAARPGVSTQELDQVARKVIAEAGMRAAFLDYHGFPATMCASVNDEVVHGLPRAEQILAEGDVLSLDLGVINQGWYTDSAITIGVGQVSDEARRLIDVTEQALAAGLAALRPGVHIGAYSAAVDEVVRAAGYGNVRELVGHGIGRELHEDPQIPNYGKADQGLIVQEGMTFALEPMVTLGSAEVKLADDGWTYCTKDGSLAAHVEHTVVITRDGVRILTQV